MEGQDKSDGLGGIGEMEGRTPLDRTRHTGEDHVERDPKQIGCGIEFRWLSIETSDVLL